MMLKILLTNREAMLGWLDTYAVELAEPRLELDAAQTNHPAPTGSPPPARIDTDATLKHYPALKPCNRTPSTYEDWCQESP